MHVNLKSLLFFTLFFSSCSSSGTSLGPVVDLTTLLYLEHFIVKTDLNGDGLFDRQDTYYKNADGQQTHRDTDLNNDGTTDGTEDYTYIDGLLTHNVIDSPTNKISNTFTYDGAGNQTLQLVDRDNDGSINWSYHSVYNAQNKRTLLQYDLGNDGIFDTLYKWTYDATGLLSIRSETDAAADGTSEYIEDKTYNAQGVSFP